MLHAIARPGKSKRDRAIHAFRVEKTSVADKFYEDEVTSSVLGPLVFLQAEDVQLIWQALLPDLAVLRGNGVADHCEVRLWDRRKIKGQPGTVEPDVRFDFFLAYRVRRKKAHGFAGGEMACSGGAY